MFKRPLTNTTDSHLPTDSGTPPQSPLPTSPAPQLIQQAPPSAHFGSAADRTSAEDSTDSSEAPNGEAFSGANDSLSLLWPGADADAEGEGSGPHWHDEDLQDLLNMSFYDVNTSSLRKVEFLSNDLNTFSWSLSICQSNGHENGFDPQRSPGLDADQHPPAPDDVPYGGYHL